MPCHPRGLVAGGGPSPRPALGELDHPRGRLAGQGSVERGLGQ